MESKMKLGNPPESGGVFLYTPEERARRDSTVWTTVQAILAPLQFFAFLVSLLLVARYLAFDTGYMAATVSILIKTGLLYLIMLTGAIWGSTWFIITGHPLCSSPTRFSLGTRTSSYHTS